MKQYFADFELRSGDTGAIYWFPLILQGSSVEAALKVFTRFRAGLEESFSIRHANAPTCIIGHLNSDRIKEYRSSRSKGKMEFLDVHEYRLRELLGAPDVTIDEHLQLVIEEGLLGDGAVLASVQQRKLPVFVVRPPRTDEQGEYLVIRIVASANP